MIKLEINAKKKVVKKIKDKTIVIFFKIGLKRKTLAADRVNLILMIHDHVSNPILKRNQL